MSNKEWRDSDDLFHRDGGPAVITYEGDEYWYQHGKLHRLCGPAVIFKSIVNVFIGSEEIIEYWANGVQVDELTIMLLRYNENSLEIVG